MKGFIITYKEGVIKMGVTKGVSTIQVYEHNGNSQSYIGSSDFSSNENHIWHKAISPDKNDSVTIELAELEQSSSPDEVLKSETQPPGKTKLELFLELEKSLKERGLL